MSKRKERSKITNHHVPCIDLLETKNVTSREFEGHQEDSEYFLISLAMYY